MLSRIELVNSIVALLSIDFHALEQDVKKEQQLKQKVCIFLTNCYGSGSGGSVINWPPESLSLPLILNYGSESGTLEFFKYSVADPGFGAFLTPGSGIRDGKKIRIRDKQLGSYFRELRNHFLG